MDGRQDWRNGRSVKLRVVSPNGCWIMAISSRLQCRQRAEYGDVAAKHSRTQALENSRMVRCEIRRETICSSRLLESLSPSLRHYNDMRDGTLIEVQHLTKIYG